MAKCGAKTRAGGVCKGQAMPNGKCRLHGGATPPHNEAKTTHGFYSKCYTDEEKASLPEIKHGTLIAELELARTQLARMASVSEDHEHYRPEAIEKLLNTVGRLEKQHAEISVDDPQGEFSQDDEFL